MVQQMQPLARLITSLSTPTTSSASMLIAPKSLTELRNGPSAVAGGCARSGVRAAGWHLPGQGCDLHGRCTGAPRGTPGGRHTCGRLVGGHVGRPPAADANRGDRGGWSRRSGGVTGPLRAVPRFRAMTRRTRRSHPREGASAESTQKNATYQPTEICRARFFKSPVTSCCGALASKTSRSPNT